MKIPLVVMVVLTACAAPGYLPGTQKRIYETAPDVKHETHTFQGARQVTLFGQSWRPPESAKGVLIVVHGLKGTSNQFGPAAEFFVRNGYVVRAFDLRGHGNSEGRRVWVDAFDDYLDDLQLEVDRARSEDPGKPIFLFGHSLGGAILAEYALLRRPEVRGEVLCAAALRLPADAGAFKRGILRVVGALFPRAAVLDVPNEAFSRDPKVVAAMNTDPLLYNANGPAATAVVLINAVQHIDANMESYSLPVLILHGTADTLTNIEGSRALAQRAKSADKTLKIYEGSFHGLVQDLGKEQVMADMLAWMDARVAPAANPPPAQTAPSTPSPTSTH